VRDADWRLQSLNRRLDNFDAALSRHADHLDDLTVGGQQLLAWAESLLDLAREGFEYRWDRVSRTNPDGEREQELRRLCDDLSTAVRAFSGTVLPIIQGSDSSLVPVELEPAVQRMAGELAGTRVEAVLYASGQLNYAIEPLVDTLKSITGALPPKYAGRAEAFPKLYFFRVPVMERDTATMHGVLMGHELGHLWNWAHPVTEPITFPKLPEEWLDEDGEQKPECNADALEFRKRARRWADEIVADVVAVHLLGPAALLALGELSSSLGPWDVDSVTHPGSDRRAAVMLEVLESLGYDAVEEVAPLIEHYREESSGALERPYKSGYVPTSSRVGSPAATAWAWEGAKSFRSTVYEAVAAYFSCHDLGFTPERFKEAIDAATLLRAGQPCGETTHHLDDGTTRTSGTDVAVILNAGWLARLDGLGDLGRVLGLDAGGPREASQISAVLESLVLKSLEIAQYRVDAQDGELRVAAS
jgi:hypothetical protein